MYLELANWESLPVEENTMSATSASQRTDSSSAFLKSPRRRLENVTCRAAALSILFISRRSLAIPAAAALADLLPSLSTHSLSANEDPPRRSGEERSSEQRTNNRRWGLCDAMGCERRGGERKGEGKGPVGVSRRGLFLLAGQLK
jgi:hypothetical protein